jgi:vancomycin resistance protein YoaR
MCSPINARVGQRTEAGGYVRAPAIINGEVYCCDSSINIGGGTSQFATTLYNAIFFGAYEDVYHKPHSIYFSKYPMGREATLGWTGPDVKFRNDTAYPVEIRASYTATSVTVELWGWNEGRQVATARSGSATTADGGTVTVSRTITYADGTTTKQYWTHRYNPLDPDDGGDSGGTTTPPPPPPPPPPPYDGPQPL